MRVMEAYRASLQEKPSATENGQRSTEEEDILQRCNKKVKKFHEIANVNKQPEAFRIPSMHVGPPRKRISYKNSLINHILGWDLVMLSGVNMTSDSLNLSRSLHLTITHETHNLFLNEMICSTSLIFHFALSHFTGGCMSTKFYFDVFGGLSFDNKTTNTMRIPFGS